MTLFFISIIIFLIFSILTFFYNNLFTKILYITIAIWLGFAFYYWLINTFFFFWPNYISSLFALIVSFYGIFHARNIVVKNIEANLPNLPDIWVGKKAVFVSDIHLGAVYGQDFLKKVVAKINSVSPDIIFIGGDLYDGVKVDETEIIKPLADLHPALGIYFITGNHEEFRDSKHFIEPIKNIGIRVLNNEMLTIDGLQLVGVDDRDSKNAKKFYNILSGLNMDKNKTTILLKHQPSHLSIAEKAGVSLQISGHTHRAQFFPLNIFSYLIFKGYDYGLKMFRNMTIYTSSGVGTWGPPLRVGSDSEIMFLNFQKIKIKAIKIN